jgi:hypothetical protein
MVPENKPNPPAPNAGAGAKEGERQGSINAPLPRYVISPQELRLLGWVKEASPGDRIDITSLLPPPPPPPGAARVSEHTRFFNFRIRFIKKKAALVILSGGFAITANPLRGARIWVNKMIIREYGDCWGKKLMALANKTLTKYGYNIFTEKWQTISLPDSDSDVRKLIALVASLIHGKERELKDPMFAECVNSSNSKTP